MTADGGWRMTSDGDLAAVRHPHAIAVDVEDLAVEDPFG
jgi:hypothetical protein